MAETQECQFLQPRGLSSPNAPSSSPAPLSSRSPLLPPKRLGLQEHQPPMHREDLLSRASPHHCEEPQPRQARPAFSLEGSWRVPRGPEWALHPTEFARGHGAECLLEMASHISTAPSRGQAPELPCPTALQQGERTNLQPSPPTKVQGCCPTEGLALSKLQHTVQQLAVASPKGSQFV